MKQEDTSRENVMQAGVGRGESMQVGVGRRKIVQVGVGRGMCDNNPGSVKSSCKIHTTILSNSLKEF